MLPPSTFEQFSAFLFGAFLLFLYVFTRRTDEWRGDWHHTYDGEQFPVTEFYQMVRHGVNARRIDGVAFTDEVLQEGGIASPARMYLRVLRDGHAFQICTAHFGTGSFVSWRLVEEVGWKTRLYRRYPLVASLFRPQTYYREDTEKAFRDLLHACVMEAVDRMSAEKGFRTLSERDRMFTEPKRG